MNLGVQLAAESMVALAKRALSSASITSLRRRRAVAERAHSRERGVFLSGREVDFTT
jgi:hypothetical protein